MKQVYSLVTRISWIAMMWVVLLAGVLYLPDLIQSFYAPRVIHVLTWGGVIDPLYIRAFEKETGIQVKLSYYASNEELRVKMQKTKGEGYDLIMPSDYMVGLLAKEGLLKKLDQTKLPAETAFYPFLLHHAYDPHNTYSLPYCWEVYGLGYDKRFFGETGPAPSWRMLFDNPHGRYNVVMTNDPIEAVLCAAQYLFGNVERLTDMQRKEVQSLLKNQHQWVEAYASARAGYFLATGTSPLAFTTTTYIWQAHQQHTDQLSFVIPQEGGFMSIENVALPLGGEHDELVYQFLNFLYKPQTYINQFQQFFNLPAIYDPMIEQSLGKEVETFVHKLSAVVDRLGFFHRILPESQLNDLWVAIKN